MSERKPLKRLRTDNVNESSKKPRPTSSQEEENINPLLSVESFDSPRPGTSSLRSAEWGVKPDTPAIHSVKSRIQKMTNGLLETPRMRNSQSNADLEKEDISVCDLSNTEDTSGTVTENEHLNVTDQTIVKSVVSMIEKKQTPEPLPPSQPLTIGTESTTAICHKLFNQQAPTPSQCNAICMRQEREKELVMVRETLDRKNPWRVVLTEQQRLKSLNKSDSTSDLTPVTPDSTADNLFDTETEERCVSTLEVRLKGYSADEDSDSQNPTSLPCKHTLASTSETRSAPCSDEAKCVPSPDRRAAAKEIESGPLSEKNTQAVNSSGLIDQIFKDVLDCEDIDKSVLDVSSQDGEPDHLLPFSIMSPLGKSVNLESVITPLNSVVSSLPELSEASASNTLSSSTPVSSLLDDASPPYSIDAYRSLRCNLDLTEVQGTPSEKKPALMGLNGGTQESALDSDNLNLKEKVKMLNEEVAALQRIIHQTSQALNCCVDEEHGKGSREEAEAERLLLVSSEKRVALLNMLTRLKLGDQPKTLPTQFGNEPEPCRGSVTISDLRLPLRMDYLCSVMQRTGKPSHYFLLLIRFGSHYIVATPLATVQDALSGDAIVFPTSVTLNDAASTFEMDIEVYSLAQNGASAPVDKRKSTRSKITPKKLLSSKKASLTSPACSPSSGSFVRTSNFLLVGSLTLSLESLNKTKFSLNKMKFEGKVGRLLGAHFQDKVPFFSPLEGNIHLNLQSQHHSKVHLSGFLTLFNDVSGFGAWHRRWCVLFGNYLSFWTYPEQEKTKDPLGQINLLNCASLQIEPASREFCARPNTFELITMRPQKDDDKETLVTQLRSTLCFTKNWLSADTKEERNMWMEQLNQALVDLRTWQSAYEKVALPQQHSQPSPGKTLTSHSEDSATPMDPHWNQADPRTPVRETDC